MHIPILRYLFSNDNRQSEEDEILMIVTPHIVRMPEWTKSNSKALYTGSEANIRVRHESELQAPQQPQADAQTTNAQASAIPAANAQAPSALAQRQQPARIRVEPSSASLKVGESRAVGVAVENASDLFSVAFLVRYDPAVISVEDVRYGDFLQAGGQPIALVLQVDQEHGEATLSATRQPNTLGVSGSGTIMDIAIKGLAPGSSGLSIVQVGARDSQQRPIQLATSEASVHVAPR